VSEMVRDMRHQVLDDMVRRTIPEKAYAEQWDVSTLHEESLRLTGLDLPIKDWAKEEGIAEDELGERIIATLDRKMAEKAANYGPELMRLAEKSLLLQLLDNTWKDHLLQLDHLRQGIGLRAYAQRDPLNEYKREAFNLFETMLGHLRETVTQVMSHLELRVETPEQVGIQRAPQHLQESRMDPAYADADAPGAGEAPDAARRPAMRAMQPGAEIDPLNPSTWGKVGRNSPCPCGSGKKYKQCHGAL